MLYVLLSLFKMNSLRISQQKQEKAEDGDERRSSSRPLTDCADTDDVREGEDEMSSSSTDTDEEERDGGVVRDGPAHHHEQRRRPTTTTNNNKTVQPSPKILDAAGYLPQWDGSKMTSLLTAGLSDIRFRLQLVAGAVVAFTWVFSQAVGNYKDLGWSE